MVGISTSFGLPNVVARETVNHSATFVDPVIGTHTQKSRVILEEGQKKIKKNERLSCFQLPSYLDEFHVA